ncbi:hypothetical protein [Thalassococcus lentus]|uniref:Uncharacterized protein n=1 Tax=Thalassococcus lentus TaxID=1210524 RepID=A0ABT4XXQ4_9RHOB|nr:hypothetical protein [Thalassococcus lentus]MDA7426672.1 hypothetical protein [Thalassococcus lentus]
MIGVVMNYFPKLVSAVFAASLSSAALAGGLQTAAGKTDLSATDCATRALEAFKALGVENARTSQNLKNWKPETAEKGSSRTLSVFGGANGVSASVMCKPFEGDLVFFTSTDSESVVSVTALWNAFYGLN